MTSLPHFDEEGNFSGAEVYAFQEGISEPVQLTAMAADGLYVDITFFNSLPRWSADGEDSFISFVIVDEFDVNSPDLDNHLCRIWIDGNDIAAIAAGAPPLTAAEIEFVFTEFPRLSYGWSTHPDVLAYCTANANTIGDIRVRVLGDDPENPVVDAAIISGIYGGLPAGCWSADDSRITFSTYNAQTAGGVWTVNADGSNVRQVAANTNRMTFTPALWSPDGSQLLIYTVEDKGPFNPRQYQLARMPAAGGRMTVLTGDMNPEQAKTALAWFP